MEERFREISHTPTESSRKRVITSLSCPASGRPVVNHLRKALFRLTTSRVTPAAEQAVLGLAMVWRPMPTSRSKRLVQ